MIFPQASRSAVFSPAHFNTIGVKLAKAAGVPIIPTALKTDFLGNGKLCKDLGPIHRDKEIYFEFGEPIMKVEGSGKQEQQQVIDFIISRLKAWGGEIRE